MTNHKSIDTISASSEAIDTGAGLEKWGYVRVSVDKVTQAAGWDDQIETLKQLGCTRFFYEEASTRSDRLEFQRMLAEANR